MALTEQQQRAAYAPDSVAVTAGAGTGKTHMLTERYLYFLRQGISPLQIVAVTFTEKAAKELRSRIRRTLAQQLTDRPDLLAELEAAQISTFHALAARICREQAEVAGVPADFAVQDEIESPLWQAESLREALANLPRQLYESVPYSRMAKIMAGLLADPLTAAQALKRDRSDWLPTLTAFRQQFLETLPDNPDWHVACQQLNALCGPAKDKRELARQQALEIVSAFEGSGDPAYLEEFAGISLRGGSHKKWGDRESFDAVRDAINGLKSQAKQVLSVLEDLAPNPYDDRTEAMLPALRDAFAWLRNFLYQAKCQQRLLDFNDLEVHALQALKDPTVQDYYRQRWQVFLIDEFQDTNPIQGALLDALAANATLTIVGDAKQSIYGFRRADVRVFQDWQARIHANGDRPVELSLSFRSHRSLIVQINQAFAPVLADLHQPLKAHRNEALDPAPAIAFYTVAIDDADKDDPATDTSLDACRRVEAQKIADLVQEMLAAPIPVHDKASGELRPIRPGDIAILSRTWGPLEDYGNAIAARNIPILQAGGGNLLETREAKDAWAMLRFLADPSDSLALVAVLRSPFFAVCDRALYRLAQSLPDEPSDSPETPTYAKKPHWWKHLRSAETDDVTLNRAIAVLKELLIARRTETPTRLLQLSDRLTGYTATLANLPGAERRLADWSGFLERVRSLEQGSSYDVLAVVRRLKRIQAGKVVLPRPALAGGDAVSLMTIHASKGLEWPVVIVPDLSRSGQPSSPLLRFDAELGLALKLEDDSGELQKSALYTLLEQRHKTAEREESKRVLYVALTRARDRIILTSASAKGGNLDLLQPGLETLTEPIPIPFQPELAQPIEPVPPPLPALSTRELLQAVGAGLSDLPVTALSDYAFCPQRFKFHHLDGYPSHLGSDEAGEAVNGGRSLAMEIGSLTHKALELGLRDRAQLAPYANGLSEDCIQEAFDLAQRFHQADCYSPYRQGNLQQEVPVSLTLGGIQFNGLVDLVGDDFVLDFKTDREMQPEHHQFQLWAYRQATGKPEAHLAYLRHDKLHSFSPQHLSQLASEAERLVKRLAQGDFVATPARDRCGLCPYADICDNSLT